VGNIHRKMATLHYINLAFMPRDCGMKPPTKKPLSS